MLGGGFLLFAAFLIGNAPAWLLTDAFKRFAPGMLTVQQAHGSLWRGRAQVQARLPQGAPFDVGEVSWRVQPLALFAGKLRAQLDAPSLPQGGSLSGAVSIGFDRVPRLHDARAQLPAKLLQQFLPQLRMMQPDGNIDIASASLALLVPQPQGDIVVTWRGFSTRVSKVNPLGDYKLDAKLTNGPIQFKLSSPAGPLLIDGTGSWSQATRLNFDGTVRLAPNAPPELINLVRLFGREQGAGTYVVNLKNF